jgi:hypothetical protein
MKFLQFLLQKILMLMAMIITPSCNSITKHLSQSMDQEISFFKRIRIRLHLFGCHLCKRYEEQLIILRQAVERLNNEEVIQSDIVNASQLSEAKKEKMKKILHFPH